MTRTMGLPDDFEFGVATASYQIEGAATEDGRGPSIWDTFSHTPGRVANGDTGDVACDHYHRYREDVALMSTLGVDGYRFSLAWPRIQPSGRGPAHPDGLDFYDRLVDELLGAGIKPMATLYHWDLPQPLEDDGGWTNRDTASRYTDYALLAFDHLSDRVQTWITHNEPWCAGLLGYAVGIHAPGRQETDLALAAAHHLLLSHGMAVQAMRHTAGPEQQFGITLNLAPVSALGSDAASREAVERADLWHNRLFTDPVLAGRYPDLARQVWSDLSDFAFIHPGDLETISTPVDFLGVNYYSPAVVRPAATTAGPQRALADLGYEAEPLPDAARTDMGWVIDADGIRRLLHWLKDTYPGLPPVYITENGCAVADSAPTDGAVHDPERVDYIRTHVAQVAQAHAEGVDVRGYYCWSFMDNFEWAEGYRKRFGLVYVDYATQERTPKDSFFSYQQLLRG